MSASPPVPQPIVLLAGFDGESAAALLRLVGRELHLLVTGSESEALRLLGVHPVAVLALGPGVPGERARRFLDQAEEGPGAAERANVVLAAGSEPSLFQELIDRDRIFYLTPEPVPVGDLAPILRSAAERWRRVVNRQGGEQRAQNVLAARILSAARSVAALREPAAVARAAAEAAEELAEADRAYCLLYDPATDTLRAGEEGAGDERRETAAVGLVSFVLRTGLPVTLERIGVDPRFDREADDPRAAGDERFAAVPVLGPDGHGLAVIAVVREARNRPFAEADLEVLRRFAEQVAPTFAQLRLTAEENAPVALPGQALFRETAVGYHQDGLRGEGDLLRADPSWMRWTYRLLLGVALFALLFSLFARVREYAAGPAVVRTGGRTDLTATTDGTVAQVLARPGAAVRAGEVLVRLYGASEAAELERIERELEGQLINHLRNPGDAFAEQGLILLRAELELARARLAEREVRAPAAGLVSDVRVRPGQRIQPGQVLLSLLGEQGEPTVLALLPGEFRPLLKPGMELRLELQGYQYMYQLLTVAAVGDDVVGPNEARRYLGDEISDAVTLDGPVVLVSARLTSPTFEVEGRPRRYHDGMWGRAEVRVRSERVLVALVPALRAFFGGSDA